MKSSTLEIFEPAMCCETGLCGTAINPELLRVSSAVRELRDAGFSVERFNLSSSPMKFVTNTAVAAYLQMKGPDSLPLVLMDNAVVMAGRYPTNAEFCDFLHADPAILNGTSNSNETDSGESGGCCCSGGNCC